MKFLSQHYDDIPEALLQGEKTILEFGPLNGLNQLISKHRDFFISNNKAGRYLGVDVRRFNETYLNIIHGDIRTFEPKDRYDIVLALHVLEHIDLRYWEGVIQMLISSVIPEGLLIVGVPNKEPRPKHRRTNHKVFNITTKSLRQYFQRSEIVTLSNKFPFSEDGASFVWAVLRHLKRVIVRDPSIRRYNRLLLVWRKESEKE